MMNESEQALADFIDIAFALDGDVLPRHHRQALADAVQRVLPWLADEPRAGLHRLNLSAGGGTQALLSRRTRLTLRVPRDRAADAERLAGVELVVGGHALRVGTAQARELLPWGTLYAHFVAAAEGADEAGFLRAVQAELAELGVACRAICGRQQELEGGALQGFSVMLDGLSAHDALRMMESGLGEHRRLGCGVFVPHKSAAAVGAPPD